MARLASSLPVSWVVLAACPGSAGHTKVCWFSWRVSQETATVLTEHNTRLSPRQPVRRLHRVADGDDNPYHTSHLEASRVTQQPMSRRQRREVERAAEAARQFAEVEAGTVPSSHLAPAPHTTHAAGTARRSRRSTQAHRSQAGAVLPDVPVSPQKQNHSQGPPVQALPPAAVPAASPRGSAALRPSQAGQQPVAPMSRMARRRQGSVDRPVQAAHPHAPAPDASPEDAPTPFPRPPSVPSSAMSRPPDGARPTRRSRKDMRTARVSEDIQQTRESPAVAQQPQPRPESRRGRRSHAVDKPLVPSAPSALSPLVAASLAESTSTREPVADQPGGSTPWWTTGKPAPASRGAAQPRSRTSAPSVPSPAAVGITAPSESRRERRASAATPASASVRPVVASTTHHAASTTPHSVHPPTPQSGPEASATPFTFAASHEIRFSRRITDFRGAETLEVPEVRRIMAARKAGVPIADETAVRAAKAVQTARASHEVRTPRPAAASSDRAAEPATPAKVTASGPDSQREPSTGPAPAHPARRRTGTGILGRTAVLSALAVATVLAPLSSHLDNTPLASAAIKMHTGGATEGQASAGSEPSSVANAVLGRDDDLEGSDTQLSNVPDAATRARIREAYQNAAKTCSSATGASGDTSAFSSRPQLFYPMLPDTYAISSEYGYRTHPTLGIQKLHAGQDMAAPVGTPIYAAAAGTVTTAGMVDGTGTVTIKHEIDGQVWYTSYLHMYEDGIYVKAGDTVTAGQMIAGVGNTGRSSGAHLHFEVRTKDDTADESTVEPWGWLKQHGAVELTTNCS